MDDIVKGLDDSGVLEKLNAFPDFCTTRSVTVSTNLVLFRTRLENHVLSQSTKCRSSDHVIFMALDYIDQYNTLTVLAPHLSNSTLQCSSSQPTDLS